MLKSALSIVKSQNRSVFGQNWKKTFMASRSTDANGWIKYTPVNPTAAVIFMHGLGDTAEGWADAMQQLSKQLSHVMFILPTASEKPVTLNMGMSMPSWYDIKSLVDRQGDTCDGIEDSREIVQSIVNQQIASGIPPSRIVLGGFSQGGALSLYTAYQMKERLAGVLVLSGYLPNATKFNAIHNEVRSTPLLMCHGDRDPVVRMDWAIKSKEHLQNVSKIQSIDWKIYQGMEHSACQEELQDALMFLQKVLPNV